MVKTSQKQVWNSIAQDWKKFRDKPRKEVEEFLKNCSGNLLDLGCGSGRHFLNKEGLKIYGTDFSEKMLKLAEKNAIERKIAIELKLMKDQKIPYNDNYFDNIICIAVLHCIETKEERENLLKEIRRVMKEKGRALIQVWSRNQKRIKNKEKEALIPWTVNKEKVHRYYYIYEFKELMQEILNQKFNIIDSGEDKNIWFLIKK